MALARVVEFGASHRLQDRPHSLLERSSGKCLYQFRDRLVGRQHIAGARLGPARSALSWRRTAAFLSPTTRATPLWRVSYKRQIAHLNRRHLWDMVLRAVNGRGRVLMPISGVVIFEAAADHRGFWRPSHPSCLWPVPGPYGPTEIVQSDGRWRNHASHNLTVTGNSAMPLERMECATDESAGENPRDLVLKTRDYAA